LSRALDLRRVGHSPYVAAHWRCGREAFSVVEVSLRAIALR